MAKRRDVELRIRAKDLGTRSLDQLNAALSEINEKLVRQRNNADLAATSTRDLAAQQKALAAAVAELAGRRSALEIFEKQEQSAKDARAEVNRLRAELAELLRIKTQGTFLGDIDKAVKTVRRQLDQATVRFEKFDRAVEESRKSLTALGVDTADLAGEFRKVDAASGAAAAAVAEVTGQIGRHEQAVAELRSEEERRLAAQREIAAEVQRRTAAEEAAVRKQIEAARALAAEEQRRRNRLADAVETFGGATPEQINARRVARLSERAATDQQAAAELKRLGIMRRASAEGQKLTAVVRGTEAAKRKYAASARRAAEAQGLFADTGRKSLSVYQRLRGQVLSLVTAYVGLFEVFNQGRKAVDTFIQFEGIEARLRILTDGDARAAAGELEFLRREADRLGLDLIAASNGFSRFAVSAKLAGVPIEEIREAFSGLSEVSAVLRLSADDTAGVFRAVDQIISKGQLSAEELRQQLGERIPGAFNQAAKAAGFTAQEFDKLLKKGGADGTDALFKFIQQYRQIVAGELPEATESLRATFNRLSNAYTEFLLAIAEGGLADELEKIAKELTVFFKSEEGEKAVKDIAAAVRTLGAVVLALAENMDKVILAFKIIIGLNIAKAFFGISGAVRKTYSDLSILAERGGKAGIALKKAGLLALSGWTGWEIGTTLKEEFVEVELAGIALVTGLLKGWERVKGATKLLAETIRFTFHQAFVSVKNTLANVVDAYADASEAFDVFGLSEGSISAARRFASSVRSAATPWEDYKKAVVEAAAATERAVNDIDQQMGALAKAAIEQRFGDGRPLLPGVPTDGTASDGTPMLGRPDFVDEGLADERIKLEEETQRQILAVRRQALEARLALDENDLEARIALINMEFDAQAESIRRLAAERKAAGLDVTESALAGTLAQVEALRQLELQNARVAQMERTRAEDLASLQEQYERREKDLQALLDTREAKLDLIRSRQELGLLSQQQAANEAAQVEADLKDRILQKVKELQEFITNNKADLSEFLNIDETLAKLELTAVEVSNVLTPAQQETRRLAEEISGGLASSISTFARALVETGGDIGDSFVAARDAFRNFAADFLIRIGEMILQAALLRALFGEDGNSGLLGGALGKIGSMIVGSFHSGGVIGAPGAGSPRPALASWFASAPRFHNGGLPGLRSDEVPAVLQKGEEVLSKSDPRNVLNGGGAAQRPIINVTNMVESGSVVTEGLKSSGAVTALVNVVKANKGAFKAVLG